MKWDPLEREQNQPKRLDSLLDSLLYKLSGSSTQEITIIINKWDSNMKESRDPNEISNLVFKVINTTNPKINYIVGGFLQKISIKLRKILPEKIYQKLIMNHYKL